MAITLNNGVILPDFPDGAIPDNSYVIIGYPSTVQAGSNGVVLTPITEFYYAMIYSEPFLYVSPEIHPMGFGGIASAGESLGEYAYYPSGTEWNKGEIDVVIGDGGLLWANHDIKIVTDFNIETGDMTIGDEIYYSPSNSGGSGGEDTGGDTGGGSDTTEHADRYSVPSYWLTNIADHARRLAGVSGELDIDGIDEAFWNVDFDSGGSGDGGGDWDDGGDTGGDSGGDSGDTGGGSGIVLPDASETYLGYEGENGEVAEIPTGFVTYQYSDNLKDTFRLWPEIYKYQLAYKDTEGRLITVYQAELPIMIKNSLQLRAVHTSPCRYVVYQLDLLTAVWLEVGEGVSEDTGAAFSMPRAVTWKWTNRNIDYADGTGTVYLQSPPLIVETAPGPVDIAETYAANGAETNSVVLSAQKITGTTSPMTFKQAVWALENYAASLE